MLATGCIKEQTLQASIHCTNKHCRKACTCTPCMFQECAGRANRHPNTTHAQARKCNFPVDKGSPTPWHHLAPLLGTIDCTTVDCLIDGSSRGELPNIILGKVVLLVFLQLLVNVLDFLLSLASSFFTSILLPDQLWISSLPCSTSTSSSTMAPFSRNLP